MTATTFEETEAAVALPTAELVPCRIIGSVVVERCVEVAAADVTEELATSVCLTQAGLSVAISNGYTFMWVIRQPRKFRKPIHVMHFLVTPFKKAKHWNFGEKKGRN